MLTDMNTSRRAPLRLDCSRLRGLRSLNDQPYSPVALVLTSAFWLEGPSQRRDKQNAPDVFEMSFGSQNWMKLQRASVSAFFNQCASMYNVGIGRMKEKFQRAVPLMR